MKTIRCNKCQGKFESEKEYQVKFNDFSAVRIADDFLTCPHCNQTDCHWIYASDYIPQGLTLGQQRKWLHNN